MTQIFFFDIFNKLSDNKINTNFNNKPIEMKLFLSFLKVDVKRSDIFGYGYGWTILENNEINLKIRGALFDGKEWLESLQFGTKLQNKYDNYVNPFYLLDILTEEGVKFFLDYYKEDIDEIILSQKNSIGYLERCLIEEKEQLLIEYIHLNILKR